MKLLHTAHVPPGDGPFPTIFALHGWGASAHDLLGLAQVLGDGWQMLCPQGSVKVPIGPGALGYGWFPLDRGQPPDPRAFRAGAAELREFVEQASGRYAVDRDRSVVLGFSQGGLMGYDLVLRQPQWFRGLAALSTWLPEILAANLPRTDAQKGFPVLVLHGTEDSMVDVARGRESRDALKDFGVDLTYREFAMGHEIRPDALREIVRWLRGL